VNTKRLERRQIGVRGVVQGVGFRPFVYRLAHDHELNGWVLNHSGGVEIEVEGAPAALDAFVRALTEQAPPLARIVAVEAAGAPPVGYEQFEIRHSVAEEGRYQLISPDIATCADCLSELLDPADRRYRYPFTNCTNCGPRFTIIRDIPYDRPLTTMAPFAMCPDCQREYDDPLDRRFHAQPNACPVCGPHIWLEKSGDQHASGDEAMRLAGEMLLAGRILAIKGLGGFHLACDATASAAVQTLRARKGRPAKPLAVMMATLEDVRRHCYVSDEEELLLLSQQCPIVLLRWRDESTVVRDVAPNHNYLGVMLPYTPLHHVLLRDVGRPLVMTSGNLSEEPIARDNDEARERLGHLADGFLMHNRDIYARYDDSVWFSPVPNSPKPSLRQPQPLRRSRGYAPFPIRLPFHTKPVLATGADLKNTFCLARDDFAFLSQHIGDMENLETLEHLQVTVDLYKHLFRVEPERVAYDMHPGYFSTQFARSLPCSPDCLVAVQHHQAHIASCLVDNEWPLDGGPVIGVAWDGTGYGLDGHIWGGEFFVGDYRGFRRAAHLEYLPLPGGDAAIRHPWRLALGYVYALTGETPDLPVSPGQQAPGITAEEAGVVRSQIDRNLNTPLTSAAGRLFDAVAALGGVRQHVSYEAQAAIELEMMATAWQDGRQSADETRPYPFQVEAEEASTVIGLRDLIGAIRSDLEVGRSQAEIGWRFHLTMAQMVATVCQQIAKETGLRTVALSGGCFQNRLLLSMSVQRLEQAGFTVLLHRRVPCNDGGISLGQVALARAEPE
jgi:hydrogenase maturation protein HypF